MLQRLTSGAPAVDKIMRTRQEQSFGEQAARFSLYAPFTALVIGLLSNGSRGQPSVAITLFGINVLLVIAGLSLGVVALLSMRRYGRQRILGRAVVGVLFNGMIITALIALVLPLVLAGGIKNRLPGHWSIESARGQAPETIAITLNEDGSFAFESSRDGATTASFSGTWTLTRARVLGITIEHVTHGDASAVGKRIGLGSVKSIDDNHMVLQTDIG